MATYLLQVRIETSDYLFIYLFISLISASKNCKITRKNRHLAKFRQKRKQKENRPCSGEGARRAVSERSIDRRFFWFVQNSCFLFWFERNMHSSAEKSDLRNYYGNYWNPSIGFNQQQQQHWQGIPSFWTKTTMQAFEEIQEYA